MTEDDPRAVLRAAADYIEQHGWVQEGYYSTPDGSVTLLEEKRAADCSACLMGAIRIVTGAHHDGIQNARAYVLVERALGVPGLAGMHEWNDEEGRTADEVVALLRAAAADVGVSA